MQSTPLIRTLPARAALAAIAALALLLTACASDDPTVAEPTDAAAQDGADDAAATDDDGTDTAFTDTDIAFLEGMVPHHAQAVDMAALVADRTAHPEELGPLAEEITATQQEEIDTMNGLLEQAGADPVDPSMGDMDMGDHSGMDMEGMDMGGMEMSGMMSAEDLTALADAEGDAFDGLFLEMMIAHHEGAIEAAQQVLDQEDGNPEVAALAEEIIAAQEAEIEQMTAWQEEWAV